MVPIHWGIGFIALNLFWVARLLLERRPVKLTEEERRLYPLVFRTLTPREMLDLLKFARWEDKAAGDVLAQEGEVHQRLSRYRLRQSRLRQKDQQVSELFEGQFVGEVSFLADQISPASVIASEPVRQVSWHKDELHKFLKTKTFGRARVGHWRQSGFAARNRLAQTTEEDPERLTRDLVMA